jgi:small ligand-binding sensory domain FIST
MRWSSALSERLPTDLAVADAASALRRDLEGAEPDLLLCFASPHHRVGFELLPEIIATQYPRALLLGCSAGGVIGAGREVEGRPALSLTAACLPGVRLTPLELPPTGLPKEGDAAAWRRLAGSEDPATHVLLLSDPFTGDADLIIAALDGAFPEGRRLGGLVSGARGPGEAALFLGRRTRRDGAVAVALSGNVAVDAIVAQGCRPIGQPQIITRCHDNVIEELTGGKPVELLRALHDTLPPRDQELFRHSLFLGIEMRGDQVELAQGDFLIRNLLGIEPTLGSLLVGARVEPYQAVQFHLRDAQASADDLRARLAQYQAGRSAGAGDVAGDPSIGRPHGALLFSCLGRGEGLYGVPDHDSGLFAAALGPVPLGGFFCNGEIGPVGAATFVHGYTSAFALFRERQ